MADYVLGLDLGSNSVGWAMVAQNGDQFDNGKPVLAGVRVFPEGVAMLNTAKEKPRGQDRRLARGMRRMHQRRAQRQRGLLAILRSAGMLNGSETAPDSDPYELRKLGLDSVLATAQFARVLLSLCKRRGFKSNRKQANGKDDGQVAKETTTLQAKMDEADARTLGEFLCDLGRRFRHDDPEAIRVRNRYTLRSMYENEFDLLWSAQAKHHEKLLTEELKEKVRHAIFFQRPLKSKTDTIGDCELEPGEKRCPRAHWLGQQFRLLQEINLLKVLDSGGEERPLNDEERAILAQSLAPKAKMTFADIRQLLDFQDSQKFNLEDLSKRDHLKGNPIEAALSQKVLNKWYAALDESTRQSVYEALAEEEDEDNLRKTAMADWGATEAQAQKLNAITLPPGYFKVSLKAIEKMMPYLQAGCVYSLAKEQAGYELGANVAVHDKLPPVDEVLKHLTNPLVHRAMGEARKVVNAIVARHGRPSRIVIELARDMKHSGKRRKELFYENLNRQKENEEIRQRIAAEFNVASPSRDDVLKYKLWQECGGVCPYTGRTIPKGKLLTGEVQIEHILPYSRTLDDSFMNKSLCYEDANRLKHNNTPLEAYGHEPDVYEQILQRVSRLPYPKRRKFSQKEIDLDECVQRQLNDTRYISRAAVGYLWMLFGRDQTRTGEIKVCCAKGGTTAELRHQWGLDGILGLDGLKNRDDHRHHAVDATVIAMTSAAALKRLSVAKYSRQFGPAVQLDPPWPTFRDDLAAVVGGINVSHRPTRKVTGTLHEETGLGPTQKPQVYVYRKPVENLTANMVEQIRDATVRKIVQQAVTERGLGKALLEPPLRMKTRNGKPGPIIKTVRIETVERTAVPIRTDDKGRVIKAVLPGGNHHVEIIEGKNAKEQLAWIGRAVTRFEANRRLLAGQPVIDRSTADGARFVMSLHNNDMVLLADPETNQRKLYRVQKMSITDRGSPDIYFRLHTAARIEDDAEMCRVRSWDTFIAIQPQKVAVDPLGRIHSCND